MINVDNDTSKQLQNARERLLDLTLRNRLLNYQISKLRTIQVIDEIPKEVFEILVLKEQGMYFKAAESKTQQIQPIQVEEPDDVEMPWLNLTDTSKHHTDRLLQTELSPTDLQKRLYYIHQQAHSVFEEQGYSVLHLALGFLKWFDKNNSEKQNLAPLVLIPIQLERDKSRSQFKIKWSEADLFPNLSLEAKLSDHGIVLPPLGNLEEKSDIDQFFLSVQEAISSHENWQVLPDIYLDFFSFTKFVMYKDLEPGVWNVDNHSLLGAVLGSSRNEQKEQEGFNAENVDKELRSHKVYHVMDADSSQIAVIEDIKRGRNLVVEGPPGTGKSQTITNIIAELLSMHKKVLFVSEKMAALEVVKDRLDRVGLGEFCLELHSHKSNKRQVLQELQRTMSTQSIANSDQTNTFVELDKLKTDLNGYVNAIHTPIGKTQKTLLMLFAIQEKFRKHFDISGYEPPQIKFSNPIESDQIAWNTAVKQLEHLAAIMPRVMPIAEHPWRGCSTGIITNIKEVDIFKSISDFETALDNLFQVFNRIQSEYGVRRPKFIETLKRHLKAAEIVENGFTVDSEVLLNSKWDTFNDEAKDLIEQVVTISKAKTKFRRWTLETDPTLKLDIEYIMDLADEYEDFSFLPKRKRFFSWKYRRKVKSPIQNFFRNAMPTDPETVRVDLQALCNCIILKENMEWVMAATQTGPSLFGNQWKGEDSNPDELRKFGEWIVQFREYLHDGTITENSVDIVSKGRFETPLSTLKEELNNRLDEFRILRDKMFECLGTDSMQLFSTSDENVFFDDLRSKIEIWKTEKERLRTWGQFSAINEKCRDTIAAPLLDYNEKLQPDDLIPCFEGSMAACLLDETLTTNQTLREFVTEIHEKKISDFIDFDTSSIELNRKRLISELQEERPQLFEGASKDSEIGILQGQFNRKRGHMPIRKLLSVAGGLVQRIKPCFMMSPLSVAQFCDPEMIEFDTIVFDEASQIRPEDALGAMLRAKQGVVLGDTRQLPPTRFFDSIVEEISENANDRYDTGITDVESILHQCRQSFPVKQLKWHYRSRHESLIAISNQEFYENDLLIFPSPFDNTEHLGLKFVHIPHSVYARGKSSANRIEAESVVQAAFEHYRQHPEKSLGIGTFNMSQQQTILDEVERQLHASPEMNEYFASTREEHFFVKNLETIQGDERDTIFLSIGYGKDAEGKLYRNFGPLNHEGGERRLNVLITRAREKCVVFSNFKASDLTLDVNAPFGTKALKTFLDYAEHRNIIEKESIDIDTNSTFEDGIYDFLVKNGFDVQRQVGCAEYRVDLGILDPKIPGSYIIGIECDGRQYRNAPVARDRDRLRQQVLKGLGWKLHRVWSMEWYQHRETTERRLLDKIERAKTDSHMTQHKTIPDIIEDPPLERETKEEVELIPEVDPESEPTINNYTICEDLGMPIVGELHLQSMTTLAKLVTKVVSVESPVHIEIVIMRIRTLWGLGKAGNRIRTAIESGVKEAEKNNQIRRSSDFLWSIDPEEIKVRLRQKPKINWICDEEIFEAITYVISQQGAISQDALISESVKLFGYKATSSTIAEYVNRIVNEKIEDGNLLLASNGMVQHPIDSTSC